MIVEAGAKLIDYICPECGSNEVCFEGMIYWHAAEQIFEVSGTCDKGHVCNDCGQEVTPTEVFICLGCLRPEDECSKHPCPQVKRERRR